MLFHIVFFLLAITFFVLLSFFLSILTITFHLSVNPSISITNVAPFLVYSSTQARADTQFRAVLTSQSKLLIGFFYLFIFRNVVVLNGVLHYISESLPLIANLN